MSRPEAIVHVGMPKTGTTSIQSWLRENKAALAGAGVHFAQVPMRGMPVRYSQIEYALCQFAEAGELLPDPMPRRVFGTPDLAAQADFAKRFEAALDGWIAAEKPAKVVLSSEHIGGARVSPELSAAADRMFRRHFGKVTYVIYLRRQEDLLVSRYSQRLRFGLTKTLEQTVPAALVHDHDKVVRDWEAAGAGDRMIVRLLEKDAMKDGDLLADFAAILGLNAADFTRPERMNESFSAAAAEFLRQLNIAEEGLGGDRSDRFTSTLVTHLKRTYADRPRLALSPEDVARVRDANAESNEALRARWFPERAELFPANAAPPPAPPPTAAELAEVGAGVVRAIRLGEIAGAAGTQAGAAPARQLKTATRGWAARLLRRRPGATTLAP
ncbi:hypothetical protein [Pseudoroseicyclus sp. CXY001]|uniref:hypothetical protein n=1 Tax=Pseudoroseicyclus sp. CXY001 TaxID=3242492 RepID=UPI00358DC49A